MRALSRTRVAAAIGAMVMTSALSAAPREQVIVVADRDATLIQPVGQTEAASGSGPAIFVGRVGQSMGTTLRRAAVRFPLEAIPPGSTITSVEITLVSEVGQGAAAPTTLHRAAAEWGEGASAATGGSGAPPQPGDATWSLRFWPDVPWSLPGGDFTVDASASTLAEPVGPCIFPSGPALVADVQAWLDDPASNFGWVIVGDELTVQSVRRFASREHADLSVRPVAHIDFEPPLPTGDIDGDGFVDGTDLALVLGSWGRCAACAADLDGSGAVDGSDLAIVLGHWLPA